MVMYLLAGDRRRQAPQKPGTQYAQDSIYHREQIVATQTLTARCLHFIQKANKPVRPYELARELHVSSNAVRVILLRLADRGDLVSNQLTATRVEYSAPQSLGYLLLQKAILSWRR